MRSASTLAAPPSYRRHRPEQTALYAIIAEHYPHFVQEIECAGGHLPNFVRQEFEEYLKCGRLEHGFLRVKCDGCRHEHLVAFSCKRRGFCPSCGARRMVESAAHLVDHVFPEAPVRQWVLTFPFPLRFLLAATPQYPELDFSMGTSLDQLQAASIQYRIAMGPHAGRKALTLYSVPPLEADPTIPMLAHMYGFSLHAGTVCEAWQRSKLERLCRYITRPPA